MNEFEDHFSVKAATYARHRPQYPDTLYAYLASLSPHHRLAWDCGTGNGQAARGLARFFDHVVATDASAEQIALAPSRDNIEYRTVMAETAGLESRSVALVTVAVAVHWFDLDRVYAEVRRVLAPDGLIAVWCYPLPEIAPEVDRITNQYLRETLSGFWPHRFRYILEGYRTLPFPFDEVDPPPFAMETSWSAADLLGFLQSWSGTTSFERQRGYNPVELIRPRLFEAWGQDEGQRTLRWRLHLRIGRVRPSPTRIKGR
jgi:SAM-dependent methyltransferase